MYDFVYVFHRNIAMACTVSEILAQIDHQGPKLDHSDSEHDL